MEKTFVEWLDTLQPWLKEIVNSDYDLETPEAINAGADLCIKQYKNGETKIKNSSKFLIEDSNEKRIVINRLYDVSNLFNLKEKNEISFNDNFNLFYGQNGSGKTSIVKLLQYANDRNIELSSNIFRNDSNLKDYKIDYCVDGNLNTFKYNDDDTTIDIDVFNDDLGNRLITNGKEINIESRELIFLQKLANYCDEVRNEIKRRINNLVTKKQQLSIPKNLEENDLNKRVNDINNADINCIDKIVSDLVWEKENDELLSKTISSLDVDNFNRRVIEKGKTKDKIKNMLSIINEIIDKFDSESLEKLKKYKKKYNEDYIISSEYSNSVFNKIELGEIGSDTWKKLWEAAREYSSVVYKNKTFPHIGDGAVCVLCQQPLGDDAKKRMNQFEEFVKSSIENDLKEDEHLIKNHNALNININKQLVEMNLNDVFINDYKNEKDSFLNNISELIEWQIEQKELLIPYREINIKYIVSMEKLLEGKYIKCEEELQTLENSETRKKLEYEKLVLEGKKWLANQKELLKTNLKLLVEAETYNKALSLASTIKITNKSKEISENLLTKNYEKEFNDALKELGADNLHVSLKSGKASKGKGSIRIVLEDINGNLVKTNEVLSTGECRVVSLAAFIADGINRKDNIPFVFDDPVSSLDYEYEEKVAKALYILSKKRQVIVFTHRLSLASLLCENKDICLYEITKNEIKGCGNIDYSPTVLLNSSKSITKSLNSLEESINAINKQYREDSIDESIYKASIDGFISTFRKIIESTIEVVLIEGIVLRFRRSIMSKNVKQLEKIDKKECAKIDELMSKYSFNEHSQSTESSELKPGSSVIIDDIHDLKNLINEHNRRVQ